MWMIVERVLIALAVVVGLTQVLIPIILDKPLFWLFRKKEFVEKDPKRSFEDTVEYLKTQKEKTARDREELDSQIEEKVFKINELKDPIPEKDKDPDNT